MHGNRMFRRAAVSFTFALAMASIGVAQAQQPTGKGYGSCEGKVVTELLRPGRAETVNDVQQSWVGDDLSALVSSWGAPTSTFENRDGTRILTWRGGDWDDCTQSFEVDANDVITRWNNRGCRCWNGQKRLSRDVPLPEMTL